MAERKRPTKAKIPEPTRPPAYLQHPGRVRLVKGPNGSIVSQPVESDYLDDQIAGVDALQYMQQMIALAEEMARTMSTAELIEPRLIMARLPKRMPLICQPIKPGGR